MNFMRLNLNCLRKFSNQKNLEEQEINFGPILFLFIFTEKLSGRMNTFQQMQNSVTKANFEFFS